jgi:hypothetical protein
MRYQLFLIALLLAPFKATVAQSQTPFETGETLHYSINWPSGLSLGEGQMTAKRAVPAEGQPARWEFDFSLEAAVPGFQVSDHVQSVATTELCSVEYERNIIHGKRKAREKTTFDAEKGIATRVTLGGGGKSEMETPACAKDALTFLYYVRQELNQGRLPPAQTIFFGAPYRIRFQYAGTQFVVSEGSRLEADRLTVSVKGPASENTFEVVFARDDARTPVLIKVPLALGNFTMELVR